MSYVKPNDVQIRELFKPAVLELLQELGQLLRDLSVGVTEDLVPVRAIRNGESTESASRAEVFWILEGAP